MRASILAAVVLILPVMSHAEETAPVVAKTNPAFARLQSLAGTWSGAASHDKSGTSGKGDVTVTYRLTAAGSVVEETLFPGTPHEMVTMYHMDGDRLVLTHYCAAGNQPHMTLEPSAEPNVLSFRCAGGTNMKETDMHMHAARITFVDADHIKTVWTSFKDGKPAGEGSFDLVRQK